MSRRPESQTDESLVHECLRRHPRWRAELLAELYVRYERQVLAICRRITRDWHDARDACQETFANAFRSLATFRQDARFSTWIHRIAVNTSVDVARRSRGAPPGSAEPATVVGGLVDEKAASPPERCVENALGGEVRRVAELLSPKLREVVRLRYFEHLSYEEIAARLGLSLGTVKSRLSRAHAVMRGFLEPVVYGLAG